MLDKIMIKNENNKQGIYKFLEDTLDETENGDNIGLGINGGCSFNQHPPVPPHLLHLHLF